MCRMNIFRGCYPITHPHGHLSNIVRAMDAAAAHDIPRVVVQHTFPQPDKPFFQRGTPEWDLHPEVLARPYDLCIEKNLPGSFTGTALESWLRHHAIVTVVIAGYMTHMCCDTTARQPSIAVHRRVSERCDRDLAPQKCGGGSQCRGITARHFVCATDAAQRGHQHRRVVPADCPIGLPCCISLCVVSWWGMQVPLAVPVPSTRWPEEEQWRSLPLTSARLAMPLPLASLQYQSPQ